MVNGPTFQHNEKWPPPTHTTRRHSLRSVRGSRNHNVDPWGAGLYRCISFRLDFCFVMPKGKTDQFTVGGNVSEYREVTKLGRNWIGFEWPVKVVTSTMNHFHPVHPLSKEQHHSTTHDRDNIIATDASDSKTSNVVATHREPQERDILVTFEWRRRRCGTRWARSKDKKINLSWSIFTFLFKFLLVLKMPHSTH